MMIKLPASAAFASPIEPATITPRAATPTRLTTKVREVAPFSWEVFWLVFALTLCVGLYSAGAGNWVSLISPLSIITIFGLAAWRQLSANSKTILTPLMGYRFIAIAMFGIGSILPVISNEYYEYTSSFYFYSPDEASRVALVWLAAAALTMIGAWIAGLTNISLPERSRTPTYDIGKFALSFYMIGLLYFVFIAIPSALGILGFSIPVPIQSLFESIYFVGIFLISLWSLDRGPWARAALVVALLVSTAIGIITYSKWVIMMPLFMLVLATIVRRASIFRLVLSASIMIAALVWLQPAIMEARIAQNRTYGDINGGSPGERLQVFFSYYRPENSMENRNEPPALVRLSYVESASYVMMLYDIGAGSNTITNALVGLVPRVIWPEKPIMTVGASDLYYQLTGREGSNVGVTIPPDIYHNAGFLGIVLLCPLMGFVFAWTSLLVVRVFEQERWVFLPAVFLAFAIGFAQDGAFVTGFFLPFAVLVVVYFLLVLLEGILWSGRTAERDQPSFLADSRGLSR